MKIWNIVKEDFEPKLVNEDWKKNVLATVIGISSLFGNVKAQNKLSGDINVTQSVKNSFVKLDIGKVFESGRYRFDKREENILSSELRKFGAEILKNPTADFIIEIVSSESRVTNIDMEPESSTYKNKLDTGVLANKRAETARYILENFVAELKKSGVLKGNVTFVTPPVILIGDTPWPSINPSTKQKRTSNDSLYTKDQFVYANIEIISKKSNTTKYSIYSEKGEPIYFNQRLIGFVFYESRKSKDISKSGNENESYNSVLFKTVVKDKQVSGNKSENVYLKTFIIPWEWWNKNVDPSHAFSEKIYNYILNNFEVKSEGNFQ
jgi:hypothetical protein